MSTIALAPVSDNDIIREYCSGNVEQAATAFVRKHQNFVYATALRFLQSYEDADDASQEVFIKALHNLNKFRGDSSVKTWLYRITMNVCTNMNRKKKFLSFFKHNEIEEEFYNIESKDIKPDESVESKEFEQKFLKELAKLPPKQRETFSLRYFDELSYEEISKIVGTSIGGLKANYFQAVKKLAQVLK